MDILINNPLQKEFYDIGKNSVKCNRKECFESFYYYCRFGWILKKVSIIIILIFYKNSFVWIKLFY